MNDHDRDQLYLYNTSSRTKEPFEHPESGVVRMFTCGPSVYREPHLGNYRTFLYEDVLQRYLEYLGFHVIRMMNLTDVEDKALEEARRRQSSLEDVTEPIVAKFRSESEILGIRLPQSLPRSTTSVDKAAEVITVLLEKGYAYRDNDDIYFDPLTYDGFGRLYGLDMSKWPRRRRRFSRDTYPGQRWNLGDFILWHGFRRGDSVFWDTSVGRGRPAWNVQDPAMIIKHLGPSIDLACGGVDNLYRHHDYTLAIMEAYSGLPYSRFYLHGEHLKVEGRKMSKSRGNVMYLGELIGQGFSPVQVRFFLTSSHYRHSLDFSEEKLRAACARLDSIHDAVTVLLAEQGEGAAEDNQVSDRIERLQTGFMRAMNDDLDVARAVEKLKEGLAGLVELSAERGISPAAADTLQRTLTKIDAVLGYDLIPTEIPILTPGA
jgi:cysteinyl-tRNA synthetase